MSVFVATKKPDAELLPGVWVKAAQRKAGGVTSAVLARRLDVEKTTVYRWREDKSPVTRLIWHAVTQALGLPVVWHPSPEEIEAAERDDPLQAETDEPES